MLFRSILVANDVLGNAGQKRQSKHSGLPVIMPDNYSIGYALGEDLISRNSVDGMSVGIVSGLAGTDMPWIAGRDCLMHCQTQAVR